MEAMDSTTSIAPTIGRPFEIDNQHSAWQFKYGYYRIIVPESSCVKYLALPDPAPSFPALRGEKLNFKIVPDGDWNIAYLTPQPDSYKYSLRSTEKTNLAGINKTWHPHNVDWMALNEPDNDAAAHDLQVSGHPFVQVYKTHFGFDKVIVNHE